MAIRTADSPYRTYAGAIASAGFEAVITGAWVVAAELPTRKRRLARAAMVATTAGIAYVLERSVEDEEPQAQAEQPQDAETLRPQLLLRALAVGVAVTVMAGGPFLRRRWLGSLAMNGHAHPHRALAVRVAAISFAGSVPARLMEMHEKS